MDGNAEEFKLELLIAYQSENLQTLKGYEKLYCQSISMQMKKTDNWLCFQKGFWKPPISEIKKHCCVLVGIPFKILLTVNSLRNKAIKPLNLAI